MFITEPVPHDFQPRGQLRKLFVEGNIKFGEIEAFAKRYIVNPDLVKQYLSHLVTIRVRKKVRQEEKRQVKKDEETKATANQDGVVQIGKPKNIYIFFNTTYQGSKLSLLSAFISKAFCERNLTLSAAETAAMEASGTQSDDDDVSVSEGSESEDELLLEFWRCKQLRRK